MGRNNLPKLDDNTLAMLKFISTPSRTRLRMTPARRMESCGVHDALERLRCIHVLEAAGLVTSGPASEITALGRETLASA